MSSLLPVATPPHARTESAPERRSAEAPTTDFATSLASVRGHERSVAGQERAAAARVHGDEQRAHRDDDDRGTVVHSRTQVQALMLSGAMKFAAARTTGNVSTPVACATPTVEQDDANSALPVAASVTATAAITRESPSTLSVALVPLQNGTVAVQPPLSDAATVEAPAVEMSASAAATVAAMQLVASLPIPDGAAVVDDSSADAVRLARADDDSAAIEAWTRRLAAAGKVATLPQLVEDHFDAPAAATMAPGTIVVASASPAPAVPAAVTLRTTVPVDAETGTSTGPVERAPVGTGTAASRPSAAPMGVRSDLHVVQNDVAQLKPEFRERLQRVMVRMKQEFGHEVTVVETVRSQVRQDALFAQGRTVPGPVVTWTRNSKHAQGQAADLMVDGAWQNPAGYAHLAQVARQEGLRTLGARDPGHVELPADASVSAETLGTLLSDLQGDAGDTARKLRAEVQSDVRADTGAAMARVANVAQVARVSAVAQVARVTTVARPGAATTRAESGGGEAASPLVMSGAVPTAALADMAGGVRVAAPIGNVNMADRISHLMDLQATQSAKPLNSVLLRMENAGGIEDQIRIDTRGTAVDARLARFTVDCSRFALPPNQKENNDETLVCPRRGDDFRLRHRDGLPLPEGHEGNRRRHGQEAQAHGSADEGRDQAACRW